MATRREFLVGKGLATMGRGKFSNAAKQALIDARANGMTFDDDETKPVAAPAGNNVSDNKAEPAKAKVSKASDFASARNDWTNEKFLMFEEPAGKTWHKTPCINCGYSVSNCRCQNCQVWDNMGRERCNIIR